MSDTAVSPFLPASERERRQQWDSPTNHRLWHEGFAGWHAYRISWTPDSRLDIGPVRRQYYSALFCHNPDQVFPFGNYVYLPEIGIARKLENCVFSPFVWFTDDRFLAERLQSLGIGWSPIEQAIDQTFSALTDVRYSLDCKDSRRGHYASHIEPRGRELARAAMFRRDEDKDLNIKMALHLIEHIELAPHLDRNRVIVFDASSALSQIHMIKCIEWAKLYARYASSDLEDELARIPSLSSSRFTQPVVRAVARALFQEIKRSRTAISPRDFPGLYEVSETVATFDGESGYIRKEYWQLVAVIVNHLAPTVLGVPLSKANPFSAEAVKKRCGRDRDETAKTLGLGR